MKIANILNNDVKNIKGTSDKTCKCGTWLKHWEKYSKKTAAECSIIGCKHDADVGAHVIKCSSTEDNHYIVPMCTGHNSIEDDCFTVNAVLISANVKNTCDI